MTTLKRISSMILVLAALWDWGTATPAAPPKPLTEVDVLKLVELKIPDDVIVKRVAESGVDFPADKTIIERLRRAGASEEVLAAVEKVAPPAAATMMSLWVVKHHSYDDNLLHSELSVNGQSLGMFNSDTERSLEKYLKLGWNTITIKTAPQGPGQFNQLIFRVGPVTKKGDKRVMSQVLWEFRNGTDWNAKTGKFTHRLGPDTKDVTLSYRLYFAGLEQETVPIGKGDYVLMGEQQYSYDNPPITATVFVNEHPVTSFLGHNERQVVITPYLKAGKNVIRLVSSRVKDSLTSNDFTIRVGGPAEYSVAKERYVMPRVTELKAMEGWERDKKTLQLVHKTKPGAEEVVREISFVLDEDPGKK